MKIVKPPQDLTVRMPGETLELLKLYQQYQKETGAAKWELKELGGAILDAFLTEGDTHFVTWRKQQGRAPKRAEVLGDANGASNG